MSSRFRNNVSFTRSMFDAARKRVADNAHLYQKNTKLDVLASDYIGNSSSLTPPVMRSGAPVASIFQSIYLKDRKYQVAVNNVQCNTLSELIKMTAKDTFARLRSLQREVIALDNEVDEANIKLLGSWTKVHLNAFSRRMDFQLQYKDRSWIEDFKTSFAYPERFLMTVLPNAGLTLPIRGAHLERGGLTELPIRDAYLISESTDFGDTRKPILSTSPRNIFLKNKTFRHVIIRREHDSSSRKYKLRTADALGYDSFPHNCVATCTLQVELANTVFFNQIDITPLGASSVHIKDITYIDEAGEEISLSFIRISAETSTTLLTEPVYAKYVSLTFEQYAPVTKSTVLVGDHRVANINKLVDSLGGWTTRMDSDATEEVSGRVYDFSIDTIRFLIVAYENKGIFRSLPIEVSSPIGLSLVKESEAILPTSNISAYGTNIVYTPGEGSGNQIFQEAYVGGRLVSNQTGAVVLDSIIPVPDAYPTQVEFLSPIGTDCRVKLFPDLRWAATATEVVDPMSIYRNGTLLAFGTDYSISIDNGSTYISIWPIDSSFDDLHKQAKAGRFYIRLTDRDPTAIYWIEYRVYKNQGLSTCGQVSLHNGRVTFDQELRNTTGTLQTILITRTSSLHPYLTSVLREYTLLVQEAKEDKPLKPRRYTGVWDTAGSTQ